MHNKNLKVIGDTGITHEQNLALATWNWQLTISGEVENPCVITLRDLWKLPMIKMDVSIECVSAGKIYGKDKASFSGVALSEIIALVCPKQGVTTVKFISHAPGACGPKNEKHCTSLEYEYCLHCEKIMLSSCLNDKPLPYRNGGPLRLIAGDERYFYKSLKWLHEIQFSSENIDNHKGTWEKYAGYHNIARIQEKEKFSPFVRRINDNIDGEINTEEVPIEEQDNLLKKMYNERNFSHLIASKIKWNFADLSGCIFSNDNISAQLRGINFANVCFTNAHMNSANFSLSKFRFAKFSDENGQQAAQMEKCDFEGADFIKAHLQNISMKNSFLRGARFYPEATTKKYPAHVKGLDIRGAIGLDALQLSWLKEDGAIVDNVSSTEEEKENFGYLPFIEVKIISKNNELLSLLESVINSENYCYKSMTRNNELLIWQYTHDKYLLNQFLSSVYDTYFEQIIIVVLPEPVWLLCSTKE